MKHNKIPAFRKYRPERKWFAWRNKNDERIYHKRKQVISLDSAHRERNIARSTKINNS